MANSVFGAIDVGSQAVRLKIARHGKGGALERLHRRRIPLRFGDRAFGGGELDERHAERMLEALRICATDAAQHRATVRAVATSSLREAGNREQVVARVRRETGIDLEVISGREEARLVCLGVLEGRSERLHSLCVDLGGGSVEVALARGEHPKELHSVPAGALRLARDMGDAPASELRARAAAAAAQLPSKLARRAGGVAVGASGTIRALVEYVSEGTRNHVRRNELARAVDSLATMSFSRRCHWFPPNRAEVIVAGAALLEALFDRLGIEVLHASKRGLRDGVLVDLSRAPVRSLSFQEIESIRQ
jgi:exopolyphosphatase/guanosine-5'-triphosphate,3'-diphosphate pyrophosphatase